MIIKNSIKALCKEILYRDIEILTAILYGDFGGDIRDFFMRILYVRHGEILLLLLKISKDNGNIISENYPISGSAS